MTHSHDRTLLARLGFADPDASESQHDLACAYLARPEQMAKIAEHVLRRRWPAKEQARAHYVTRDEVRPTERRASPKNPTFERLISKGTGQYKTTIGFADLVFEAHAQEHRVGEWEERGGKVHKVDEWDHIHPYPGEIVVEVKIRRVQAGVILRQLKLYGEHIEAQHHHFPYGRPAGVIFPAYVTAIAWEMPAEERAMLTSQGIDVIRLGPGFDAFVQAQASAQTTAEPLDEI